MLQIIENCVNPIIIRDTPSQTYNIHNCGKCQLCRRKKANEWKVRCIHELLYTEGKKATFITLTYNKENLPKAQNTQKLNPWDKKGTLKQEDVQLFIKRLRKKLGEKTIRYIYCGEYGTKRYRPHYHLIIFGLAPEETLKLNVQEIWGKGYADIDLRPVSENAIAYLLGYVRKKIDDADINWKELNRVAPYQRQSQGIGKKWAIDNMNIIATGKITTSNGSIATPRYYLKKMFEIEGKKVRYTTEYTYHLIHSEYNLRLGIKRTKNKYNYKIIKNFKGKLTNTYYKNKMKNIKKIYREYEKRNINIIEFKKMYFTNEKKNNNINYYAKLNYIEGGSFDVIEEKRKFIHIKEFKTKVDRFILSNKDTKNLHDIALMKEEIMLKSPFGKRKDLDLEN